MDDDVFELTLHRDVAAKVKAKELEDWFYTPEVKEHFFNPKNLLKDPSELKDFKFNGYGSVGSPACGDKMDLWIVVDPSTEKIVDCRFKTFGCFKEGELVASADGFVKIEEVKIGDKVLNHLGEEAYVVETSKRKIRDFLYEVVPVVSKHNSLNLTGEHPILAIKRGDLKRSRKQKHTSYLRVDNKTLISSKPDFFLAESLNQGDYLVYQAPRKVIDSSGINETELKLLGFYLSEGYFSARERSSGKYGVVAFAFHKNERAYINELKLLLKKKFNKDARERIRDNVSETYICSREAVRFFDKYCGHIAKNKKLHSRLIYLPLKKQAILLDYYFKGDGHLYKDKRKNRQDQLIMSTASEILALQLQQIIARLGFFATISKRKTTPSIINGRLIGSKVRYIVCYVKDKKRKSFAKKAGGYFLVPIKDINKRRYHGYVYNFGVSGNNKSYLCKGLAVHNCGSAIASTSVLTVMITENGGMSLDDALKIKPQDIVSRLGDLPKRKFHCSVLGDKALRVAINDYFRRTNQHARIIVDGAQVIDTVLKITDKDIEEAVLEGAHDLESVQKKTKVGVHDKSCIPKVVELINFYTKKYYG